MSVHQFTEQQEHVIRQLLSLAKRVHFGLEDAEAQMYPEEGRGTMLRPEDAKSIDDALVELDALPEIAPDELASGWGKAAHILDIPLESIP